MIFKKKNHKKNSRKINTPSHFHQDNLDNLYDNWKKSIIANFDQYFYWNIWSASSHISFRIYIPDHIWVISYLVSKSLTKAVFPYSKNYLSASSWQKSSLFSNLKNLFWQLNVHFQVFFISLMLHHAYFLFSNFEMLLNYDLYDL